MQRARPDAYSFAPSSWVLPDDYSRFLHACKEAARNSDDPAMFIVKPERGCQGKRIFLTRTADEDVIRDTFWTLSEVLVAQSYIQRPLIFDGLKFDLRLYALVTCVDPLRVYLYRDGLVRFCTEPYAEATALNKDHVFMHLTNHSLNKSNAAYEDSTDALDPTVGSKRRLVPFLDLLSKRGAHPTLYPDSARTPPDVAHSRAYG
jgi:tubulin polyglutamylase TTLL6/13